MINQKSRKGGINPGKKKKEAQLTVDKELAAKIKSLIIERGLKMVHVSNSLGISKIYFNLLLNGHRPITPEVRQRIANYLGVVL